MWRIFSALFCCFLMLTTTIHSIQHSATCFFIHSSIALLVRLHFCTSHQFRVVSTFHIIRENIQTRNLQANETFKSEFAFTFMICETKSLSAYFFCSSKAQLRMQIPSQFFSLILYRISSHKKAKNLHVLEQSSLPSLFSALLLYFNSTRLCVTTAEDTTQKKENRQHSGEGL